MHISCIDSVMVTMSFVCLVTFAFEMSLYAAATVITFVIITAIT